MSVDELAYQVAKLYYLNGLTQQQIADKLDISRSKVSRLLSYARDRGIVEVKLNPPAHEVVESLSNTLKEKLSLKEVVVVEVNDEAEDILLREIAKAGASYITKVLKDGQVVGWGWGRTVFWTINSLCSLVKYPSSIFVPLIGGAGQSTKFYQVNSFVEKASEVFRSRFVYLNAPAFFANEDTLKSFSKEKQVKSVMELWKRLDVAIFGLGKPIYDSEVVKSEIDPYMIVELIREGAVGDILARFFDRDGKICDCSLNKSILGIALEDLKRVPLRICLCGGRRKVDGIIAAAKRSYLNVLITDTVTAKSILERLGKGDMG